jgi:hypothetical protein
MTDRTKDAAPETRQAPRPEDVRGEQTTRHDRSAHRSHAWLYEDLLA